MNILGAALWSGEGSSRLRPAPVLDPDIIRSLDVGQVAYTHRGGVTFVQVKRLVAAPAALAPPTGEGSAGPQAASTPAGLPAAAEPAPAVLPDAGPLLDEAFGTEPR